MTVLDFHSHVYPPALAEKAVGRLSARIHSAPTHDGTAAGLLEKLPTFGLCGSVALNIATTPHSQKKVNDFAIEINKLPNLYAFGSVHPYADDPFYELDRIMDAGLYGVKLHPFYQDFRMDDKQAYKIYERCANNAIPLLFHSGQDVAYPGADNVTCAQVERLVHDFEGAPIILAHMGLNGQWDELTDKVIGHDIYFDTSLCIMMDPKQAEEIILAHGSNRILFGSDSPWKGPKQTIDYIDALPGLSAADKSAIFFDNAKELLRGCDKTAV